MVRNKLSQGVGWSWICFFIEAIKIKTLILFRFKYFIGVSTDYCILDEFELIKVKCIILKLGFNNFKVFSECFFIDFHELGLIDAVEIRVNYSKKFVYFGY
jgi:hypothetical protein